MRGGRGHNDRVLPNLISSDVKWKVKVKTVIIFNCTVRDDSDLGNPYIQSTSILCD